MQDTQEKPVAEKLGQRIDAALGRTACDTVLQNTHYLDVFNCEWKVGDLGILDGTLVAFGKGLKGKRFIDCKDRWVVPGFIDAHVHVESSLMVPKHFQNVALRKGTTTAISDPHEIANVMGTKGIRFMLEESSSLAMDLRIMLSSCVPATHMETNGAGVLNWPDLAPLKDHPKVLGLAEMMNVPGVLHKDPSILEKLSQYANGIMDGHCPLLTGTELDAYASTGITSCHEVSRKSEAKEKMEKGMRVWIREGSVAKDLKELIPLLNMTTSTSMGFCTDDRNPLDIASEGHIDYLVRQAIHSGVPPEVAFRSASWTVAMHYGLDRGLSRRGAIAPGFRADLVLLSDLKSVEVERVFVNGTLASEIRTPSGSSSPAENTIRAPLPTPEDLTGPQGRVHVIQVLPGKIITERKIESSDAKGVARLSVLGRYGTYAKPANGYVRGFGENFSGAIASSVGHDSHNLIAVGSNTKSMRAALLALIQSGGGFVVVRDETAIAHLPLPIAGLMSNDEPAVIEKGLKELRKASLGIGCDLKEPFLQLAFLSLPVIPKLKLTDKGLVDVEQFQIIDVRA